jgi:phage/conjugal plasmid C-4 type zinc finger TraR family protein
MNDDIEKIEYNNEEEAEIAQINSLITTMNAVSALRNQLEEQRRRPSLEQCADCGGDIPEARRQAIKGVQLCIHCQTMAERLRATYRPPGVRSE